MAHRTLVPYRAGMSASLAPTLLPNPVAIWHGAIEAISPHVSPCRHMPPSRWAPMRDAALAFCDQFGEEALRLGWTAPQLFGVHPEDGTLRLDYCGVLMTSGSRALGVEVNRIVFERGSGYRNKPGQVWGVPVWEFDQKGA